MKSIGGLGQPPKKRKRADAASDWKIETQIQSAIARRDLAK